MHKNNINDFLFTTKITKIINLAVVVSLFKCLWIRSYCGVTFDSAVEIQKILLINLPTMTFMTHNEEPTWVNEGWTFFAEIWISERHSLFFFLPVNVFSFGFFVATSWGLKSRQIFCTAANVLYNEINQSHFNNFKTK